MKNTANGDSGDGTIGSQTERAPGEANATPGRLTIRTAPREGEVVPLRPGRMTIGRTPENDLVIDDPTLSHRHCELKVSELFVRVRDLDSTNGTFVDGARVQEAELLHGQVLSVGRFDLSLEFESARVAIPPPPLPPAPPPTHLEDGREACRRHSDQAATQECSQCGGTFCPKCVRDLHVSGGKHYRFCPDCGGHCQPLRATTGVKRLSFLERVRQSLFGSKR